MLNQIAALAIMSLRGLPQRPLSAIVTIVGVATMVAVMTALLALGAGITASTIAKVQPDMAVVVARGAASDYLGSISRPAASAVMAAPGVQRDGEGNAQAMPTASIAVNAMRRDDNSPAIIYLVGAPVEAVVPVGGMRLTDGRLYRPGLRELVVGTVAGAQYADLQVGDRITLRGVDWAIVGEFASDGGVFESGLYGDLDTVMSAYNRTAFQQIEVRLTSLSDFNRFREAVVNDPRFTLDVKSLREHLQDQMSQVTSVINFVAYFVGAVMALGALFGILNTMYAAIDARQREFATLRALGFGGMTILISITVESLALALPGAAAGVAIAWLVFDGDLGQISNIAFPITMTPGIAIVGVSFTLAIGLIGGLLPSVAASRRPIATALRAS